ncbi:tetracycline resistance MFS efflux pump [Chryseobacterium elymi]|uniref:Tetracycline resistance MFS efflux pump n=1 Tax=Chryseobacterium elymi TaxID=395936 RepID=A0A3D9DFW9_9FLAO|nr:TCR/Tet family MFS transporter [Chryseobacterium elymi]REC76846.1 tetracycline resistance MFS efflux pump [Chryseobacterium elymi]
MHRKKNYSLIFIFITILIDIIGIGIVAPVLPTLILKLSNGNLSTTTQYIGWFIAIYALMQFVFAPILGNLSDRYGRRPVLLWSSLGLGIDYLILAFAPSLIWLFAGRIVTGIMGSSMTTATAYVSDISTPEKKSQNFGMISAVAGLGLIIGPVIGGILGQYGERIPFYAASVLSLLNFIYGVFVLPESLKESNRRPFSCKTANPIGAIKSLKKEILAPSLIIAFVFIALAGHAMQSTWNVYGMKKFGWKADMIGYSLGFFGVLMVICQGLFIGLFINKLGQKRAIMVCLFIYCVSLLLFGIVNKSWMAFAVMMPYVLGGMASPILLSLISSKVSDNKQGLLQGGLSSIGSVTAVFGPLLMTNVFAYFTSAQSPFYFSGASFILASFLASIGSLCLYFGIKKETHFN